MQTSYGQFWNYSFLKICFLYQQTPLHLAVSKGRDFTAKRLFNKGAVISIKDKDGVSALHEYSWLEVEYQDCEVITICTSHNELAMTQKSSNLAQASMNNLVVATIPGRKLLIVASMDMINYRKRSQLIKLMFTLALESWLCKDWRPRESVFPAVKIDMKKLCNTMAIW